MIRSKHITWAVLLSVVALPGCKNRQTTGTTETPVDQIPRPAWVQQRPIGSFDYIGIGTASKSRPDWQEAAKKNALNDLASEISVNIEGNSLLYTLDRKTSFDETYTSTIQATTREQLEGFEQVETWENATEFWTYYRLDKSKHAAIKAEKKRQALAQASDFHARSRACRSAGDLKSAFDLDLRALLAMREYWGESDMVEVEGKSVPLANTIFGDLQQLTSNVRFQILPERCELTFDKEFRRELLISAALVRDAASTELVQLPVSIEYPGSSGKVTETKNTDSEGRLQTTVQRVQSDAASPELLVKLDMDALVSKDLDQAFVRPLLASLTVPEKRAVIEVHMPRVHMQASEKNFNTAITDGGSALVLKEELTKRGFRFVDKESECDMVLQLNGNTREGGIASGFHTAYLDLSVAFRERRSGDVVYEGGKQSIKGVQLDYPRAGMDAYKKAAQDLRKEIIPALLDALL
ncbi:MAG: LPP20 family lipoprotein [Flavobacteriales bacterium]